MNEEYTVWPEFDEQAVHEQHQFCFDPSCGCHTDTDRLIDLDRDYLDGLLSGDDYDRVLNGKGV